jgi:trimeric autotransporter adhesin
MFLLLYCTKIFLQMHKAFKTLFIGLLTFPYIAAGQVWNQVGSGLDAQVTVFVADTVNKVLYAAGKFTKSGNTPLNHIAKWNGLEWEPLGSGISSGTILTMEMYNGELYIGGHEITNAGGVPVKNIAKWNGVTWSPVGPGFKGTVNALKTYKNELYVGSYNSDFTPSAVSKWNGNSFSGLGTLTSGGPVLSLTVFNNELYIAGDAGIKLTGSPNIVKWDGVNWSGVGGGVNNTVWSTIPYNSTLIVRGAFNQAGSVISDEIAEWDGTNWRDISPGILFDQPSYFTVYDNKLIAGYWQKEEFPLMTWDGSQWARFCSTKDSTFFSATTTFKDELYVSGAFTQLDGKNISYVARWGEPLSLPNNSEKSDVKLLFTPSLIRGTGTISYHIPDSFGTPLVNILNMNGMHVKSIPLDKDADTLQFDATELGTGIFFYELCADGSPTTVKGKITITR